MPSGVSHLKPERSSVFFSFLACLLEALLEALLGVGVVMMEEDGMVGGNPPEACRDVALLDIDAMLKREDLLQYW